MAEPIMPDKLIPGGAKVLAASFPRKDRVIVTLAAGAIVAGAGRTLLTATALTGDITAGTIIDFGAGKFATLTVVAIAGASSILGVTLAVGTAGGEVGTYPGTGDIRIESGILLGRTFAERDAGAMFGPYATADDEVYVLAFQVNNADLDAEAALVRPQVLIRENWLPGWAAYTADAKAALRKTYQVVRG